MESFDLFQEATRLKLRYQTSKGSINTEDLWELSLTSLNDLAKELNKQCRELEEESFIDEKSSNDKRLEIAFELVKYIIRYKLNEKNNQQIEKERLTKKEQLISLLRTKEEQELTQLSMEQIKEMLNNL